MHYYQFNIGDYASHTSRLTLLEDLAYRRMLDLYYLNEQPLNGCITDVAREVGLSDHVNAVEYILSKFFTETETGFSVNEPVNYATRAAIEQAVVELVYEGERKGLWKFKDNTYKGSVPMSKPMKLSEALLKWPDAKLYCDANNMCYPNKEDTQEGNNEVKNVDNTSNGNVNGTSGNGE